jgi:hypothetical protein
MTFILVHSPVEGCWGVDYIRVLNLIIRDNVDGVWRPVMMS